MKSLRLIPRRVWHWATGAHIPDDRNAPHQLCMCDCGWKDDMFKRDLHMRRRRLVCLLVGHDWDDPYVWSNGPIDHDDVEDHVEWDPEKRGGEPVIVHTRIPTEAIVKRLEGGDPEREILEDYPYVREETVEFLGTVAFGRARTCHRCYKVEDV